ncbi:redox-regulated ATPase YchF [Candidatus Cyrtobacter comes]|uniref:redox-regulated ATPase YchF n=1 Tax=Candidatus Cyrtobacter comes TaxID=675776 RepID=UPI002ACE6A7B|nr:redox-regulated ATPase YchF [Candidatus Cyrtobacter comes]
MKKYGIVGLPNVGKSTLFNALTNSLSAAAENYPFCTIEPNIAVVSVPDERLHRLAKIAGSQKIISTHVEFVDIAGLVKGASKGEGLGNKFLSHIREVDCIIYVLRCFHDENVTHVEGRVNPIEDLQILRMEFMLADIESLEKRIPKLTKMARQDKEAVAILKVAESLIQTLSAGNPVSSIMNEENSAIINSFQLLSSKKELYVCNVNESECVSGNDFSRQFNEFVNNTSIVLSAKIEQDIANMTDEEEKKWFMEQYGIKDSGLNKLIRLAYDTLDLITFFTIGPKEARAWSIENGINAPKAAGCIHTDFEKGFIRAEVIGYEDYISYASEAEIKAAGKSRLEGRDYIMKDGDVVHFRFNV